MFLALAVLLAMEVTGSGISPPDIKDFTPVLSKELEFRIDDYKTAFVGRVVDYQNPNDPNEFVQVYYRQAAIVSERAREKNAVETDSRDGNLSNLNYHHQQEAEILNRVQRATDAFAYVRWRIIYDPRIGQDIKTGFFQIWLLDSSGVWTYHTQPADEKSAFAHSPFSEPSKVDPKKRINVGILFSLADAILIVRIDQDDVQALVKEITNDKK